MLLFVCFVFKDRVSINRPNWINHFKVAYLVRQDQGDRKTTGKYLMG
jgi:hypothetical protein